MKILLIAGHGNGDSGALGCGYKECDLTREIVNLIAPKLRAYATVDVYDQKKNAYQDVQNGTFKIGKYDYALEVHLNAFNGEAYGTEIFVTTMEKGTSVEEGIVKNLSKHFKNRGVKVTDFLVIKTIKKMGISSALVEVCFIDNKNDMKTYQANKDAIAQGIVNGIASGFGLKKKAVAKPKPKTIKEGSKVKIKNGAKYGGLSTARGRAVPLAVRNKKHTVVEFGTHKGVKEARLKEINSWVAVASLTLV